jgi:hypothetical protein
MANGLNLAQWSAGVLAGWLGGVSPPNRQNPQHSLITRAAASLAFGGADAAGPAGETPALRPQTSRANAYIRAIAATPRHASTHTKTITPKKNISA